MIETKYSDFIAFLLFVPSFNVQPTAQKYPTASYFGSHWIVKQQMFCSDLRESGCWIFIKKYFFPIIYPNSNKSNYEIELSKLTVWKTLLPYTWMSHSLVGWWEIHTSSLLCKWENNLVFFFLFQRNMYEFFWNGKSKIYNWFSTLRNVPWTFFNLNSEKKMTFLCCTMQ